MSKRRGPHNDPLWKKGKDRKYFNPSESWERSYRGVKKRSTRVKSHMRNGHRVNGHIRRLI